jgi:DNA polymerase-3 subunit delta
MEAVWNRAAAKTLFAPLRRAYCFHGEDDRQKDEAIAQLRQAVVDEGFADFDFEVLEADSRSPDEVLAAVGIAPFGSPARLVVLRGAEIYRKRERSGDAERLAAGIAVLSEGSCLVLRVGAAEDEKGRGKTVLTQKLDKAIGESGVMVHCRALSDEDLAEWVAAEAAKSGKRIEPAAARHVVATGRGSRAAIANELEKAICFAGDQPVVTLAMARATASYDPEDVMFKLVDAIVRRNADSALQLFHEILRYDPKPQAIAGKLLALLSRQLRLIAQANELARMRIDPAAVRNLPPEVAAELPQEGSITAMAWKARDIYAQGRGWSADLLTAAFGWMVECDLNNKGGGEGSEDVTTNMELLILRLCGVK